MTMPPATQNLEASLQCYQVVQMEGIESKVTNTSQRLCLQKGWWLERFLFKLEGTLEAGPCRWLPVCLPRGIPPEELVMGRIADFSSGSCVERRDSLSLGQWKDQRHLGCA